MSRGLNAGEKRAAHQNKSLYIGSPVSVAMNNIISFVIVAHALIKNKVQKQVVWKNFHCR